MIVQGFYLGNIDEMAIPGQVFFHAMNLPNPFPPENAQSETIGDPPIEAFCLYPKPKKHDAVLCPA